MPECIHGTTGMVPKRLCATTPKLQTNTLNSERSLSDHGDIFCGEGEYRMSFLDMGKEDWSMFAS